MKHLYLEDGSVNPAFYSKDVIIYGCGNNGRKLYLQLCELGKKVMFFCDSNVGLVGKKIEGISIIAPKELIKYKNCNIALAFFQWNEVIHKIPEESRDGLFADFLYEHVGHDECLLCHCLTTSYDRAHFAPFIQERMFGGEKIPTKIIHCHKCDLFFSKYRPKESEIKLLYDGYRGKEYQIQRNRFEPDYTFEKNENVGDEKERKKRLEKYLKKWVEVDKIKNVLDYGGDRGQMIPQFFYKAKKYVYEISGNESEQEVITINTKQALIGIKWDFIMCCQLLEHVSDPIGEIDSMITNLREKSYLYLEVPHETFFRQYSDVEINEHINFFSEKTMYTIGELFNLEIIDVNREDNLLRALYYKM